MYGNFRVRGEEEKCCLLRGPKVLIPLFSGKVSDKTSQHSGIDPQIGHRDRYKRFNQESKGMGGW